MKSNPDGWIPITQHTALFYAFEQVMNRDRAQKTHRRRRVAKWRRDGAVIPRRI